MSSTVSSVVGSNPNLAITVEELHSVIKGAFNVMFPKQIFDYTDVSVLLTYGPGYVPVPPDVVSLASVLQHLYGFTVHLYGIGSDQPRRTLFDEALSFVEDSPADNPSDRRLKIVVYAGNTAYNWNLVITRLSEVCKSDVLLLLDCCFFEDYLKTWKTSRWSGENVIEMISAQRCLRRKDSHTFTQALANAFGMLHEQLHQNGKLAPFTAGLLFNALLDCYQCWSGNYFMDHLHAPAHTLLKQHMHEPRAIQLHPRPGHSLDRCLTCDASNRWSKDGTLGNGQASMARLPGLFDNTPFLRLEVALQKTNTALLSACSLFPRCARHPAVAGIFYNYICSYAQGTFTLASVPAALEAYMEPSVAIFNREFVATRRGFRHDGLFDGVFRRIGYVRTGADGKSGCEPATEYVSDWHID